MGKPVTHYAYVRKGLFGSDTTITGSACGRETGLEVGINSDDDLDKVTCKLCLKHPRYLKAKAAK